jgi:tRNA nucleotidyltransferase (CCA-adding enzyme)
VLHNLSFVEDPTRALRAVRFSEKFNFKIERHTLNMMKNSIKLDVFAHLSGARLLDELRNILEEEGAGRAIQTLHELGLLSFIHKDITWDEARSVLFERARDCLTWHRLLYTRDRVEDWLVLFLVLTDPLKDAELVRLAHRLSISGKRRSAAIGARAEGLRALERINAGLVKKNSALYSLLKPLPLEAVIYLMAKADKEEVKKALSNYITKLKDSGTLLKGEDLLRMGLSEGTEVGRVLERLFFKRLDNELLTRADEEGFVRGFLKSARPGGEERGPKA